jgi:hypothetical protein
MSEPTYSLVYDRDSASRAFPGVSAEKLVVALLATLPPAPDWEACQVYRCPSPLEGADSDCLVTRGKAAEAIQEHLVEAMEKRGITVIQLYEGGPESGELIARVEQGLWQ